MKQKLMAGLLATSLVAMSLTGCGNSKENTETTESTVSETESVEQGVVDNSTETLEGEVVDITVLYDKSEYETINYDDYLTFGDYSEIITLKETDYTVTEEDIKEETDYYCEIYGTTEQITDKAIADGDIANIDFVGTVDGETFSGGSYEGYELEIGSNSFIDGFEDGLLGVKPGETKTLNLKFPDEYPNNPDLAGKDVVFEVTVNYINGEIIPAEYTNELVTDITGGDYTTTEDFNEYIKVYLETQKKQTIVSNFKTALLEITEFKGDITKWVEEEYEHGLSYYESYASNAGYTLEDFATACGYEDKQELLDYIKSDSETYVKEKIMLYAFGSKIGYEMTDEEVMAGAEKIVSLYGYGSVEALISQYNSSIIRFDVYGDLIANKIIEMYK